MSENGKVDVLESELEKRLQSIDNLEQLRKITENIDTLDEERDSVLDEIKEIEKNISNYNLIAEKIQETELNRLKKFVKEHQSIVLFIITTIAAMVGYYVKLLEFYSTVGKFHYWGIDINNVSVFGNGLDRNIFWGLFFLFFLILFFTLNKWTYKGSGEKKIIDVEKNSFWMVYIPVCMAFGSIYIIPYLTRMNYSDYNYNMGITFLVIILLFSIIVACISRCEQIEAKWQCFVALIIITVIVAFLFSVCMFFKESSRMLFCHYFKLISVKIAINYVICLAIGGVYKWVICQLVNIWIALEKILILYSNSDFREKVKGVLLVLCLVVFTGLFIAYVAFGNLPLLNNYVIVDAKLSDKDKSQDYVVLLEHNNQYYISEFEIIGEEIKIFNGEYWIISKEGIKIRNQQFNGTVKTNKSRDEYYVQSQSPSSATMNGS